MTALFACAGTIVGCVVALWLLSLKLRDVSIADIWWGPGFAVIAWVGGMVQGVASDRLLFVQLLLTAWGLRLGIHLAWRNWGHEEDRRYGAMRSKTKAFWWVSLFKVFLLQGAIQLMVAAPIFGMLPSTQPLQALDYIGLSLVVMGVLIEGVSDFQLARFLGDPLHAGRVMDRGFWGLSRHPNYFGNALMWVGFGLVGLAAGASPWTVLGPILMVYLLLRVSGVSMLESTITDRRPEYRRYKERVSAFIPLPPRS